MNVFITGGNGFLGKTLVKTLILQGHNCVYPSSSECNLLHSNSLEQYSKVKFDLIFHLAAWTQAGDFCLYHPGEQWINNQKINTNVLDWWLNFQPEAKLVFMGTSCAYSPGHSLDESEYMKGEPVESLYTYAMTKRMLLQGALALQKQYNLKWLCAVPSTLYGPNYHTDGRQMHFIFDLVRKILRGKQFNDTVSLWGHGYQKREIIHVDDFTRALLIISSITNSEIVNIGSGIEYSIRDYAKVICEILDYDENKILYDTNKYIGADSKCLSISKLTELYPNFINSLTPLRDGIRDLIKWFIENNAHHNFN